MADEFSSGIRTVFFESLQIAETAVFIDEGVLVIITAILCCIIQCLPDQARLWNIFHIDLYSLAGISHLFIRLGNILWVWQFHRHLVLFP